jgi:hypothetical protein
MALASSFTVVPFIAGLLADNANAFRFLALPGGAGGDCYSGHRLFRASRKPALVLAQGPAAGRVDIVNRIRARSGNKAPPLTIEALGDHREAAREPLPPHWALFAKGQLRWTTVGILSGICAGTAFFLISVLLPKALNDQGFALSASLGLTWIVYAASFFGKGFTGFLMEIIGRRWTIAYALTGSLPGLVLMLLSHRARAIGAFIPIAFGRETVGPLETVTEGIPALA